MSRPSLTIVVALMLGTIAACHRQSGPPSRPSMGPETVSDGYGEKARGESGGVESVSFEDGPPLQVSRVEELIEARFPGVEVRRTADGNYSVIVRGIGSFMSSEQPLYVIDGTPYQGSLGWLAPSDVVRIALLKNPTETSIYGVRGSNGVFVISTKRKR
jgi:TonB-dependent starch-binding outer membrane protein SusC